MYRNEFIMHSNLNRKTDEMKNVEEVVTHFSQNNFSHNYSQDQFYVRVKKAGGLPYSPQSPVFFTVLQFETQIPPSIPH